MVLYAILIGVGSTIAGLGMIFTTPESEGGALAFFSGIVLFLIVPSIYGLKEPRAVDQIPRVVIVAGVSIFTLGGSAIVATILLNGGQVFFEYAFLITMIGMVIELTILALVIRSLTRYGFRHS